MAGARGRIRSPGNRQSSRSENEKRQGTALPGPQTPRRAPLEKRIRAMKCPREMLVLDAVRKGEWTPALRQHVASCEECAAAADVAQWMESFASNSVPRRHLPDP